jgi:hypothetical protein
MHRARVTGNSRNVVSHYSLECHSTHNAACLKKSQKFLDWRPSLIDCNPSGGNSLAFAKSQVVEKHFSSTKLAKAWGVSIETIPFIFTAEFGVVKIGEGDPEHKKPYLTLRIPESVAVRVHRYLFSA